MARIRSVKPELRTSLVVAEWPREVRYFWVLLWGFLDDHGRGVDDARLIKADCFPLDEDLGREEIDGWLDLIASSGPLCRFQSNGKRYLHVPSWSEHQRPSHPGKSRVPPCPLHDTPEQAPETLAKPSGDPPETLVPEQVVRAGSREQGAGSRVRENRGQHTDADFARFWDAYPRREAKTAARKAWDKATQTIDPSRILAGAERYRDDPGREPRYTAHPATWLNAGRWDDEALPARASPDGLVERNGMRVKPETAQRLDDLARWQAMDEQHQLAIGGSP